MGKTRRSSQEMYPLVECYLQGSQGAEAFCAERGISLAQLYHWRRKYLKRTASAGEAFLEISAPAVHGRAVVEVLHPDGALVRFFVPVPASFLVSVFEGSRA